MKKVFRVLLCCLLAFCMTVAFGCKAGNTPNEPDTGVGDNTGNKENPDEAYDPYVDWTAITDWTPENIKSRPVTDKDILIGSYVSYCDTAEKKSAKAQLKILADGGLNFMPLAELTPSFGMIQSGESVRRDLHSLDWWKKIDDEMVKRNMLYYFSSAPRVGFDTEACAHVKVMTDAASIAAAKKIVPQLENCIGYHITDEPNYSEFDGLAAAAKQYAAIKPGMDIYVNFTGGAPNDYNGANGYYGFLKSWIDKCGGASTINLLSHDLYAFRTSGAINAFQTSMEDMRKLARVNSGLKLGCFLQSCAWNGYAMPNFDEIKWTMNSYLASGFSRLVYFNYAMYPSEGCSDAIISQKGQILHKDTYDSLASYHFQVRAMGVNCHFTDLSASNVYYTSASRPSGLPQLPATGEYILLDGLTGGSGFIVSYLANASGTEKYMFIVNNSFGDTYENKTFKVGAKADDIAKMELYDLETGKFESLWESGDSSFALSFGKSDMKVIRLISK